MKIVFTCGVFDLYHIGHLNFLKESKSYGDILITGVNTDEFTISYKNKKPVIPFEQRIEIIGSCKYVDVAVKAEELWPKKYMIEYNVDIITVSSDWKYFDSENLKWAVDNNIKIVYIDYTPNISTSYIIKTIKTYEK